MSLIPSLSSSPSIHAAPPVPVADSVIQIIEESANAIYKPVIPLKKAKTLFTEFQLSCLKHEVLSAVDLLKVDIFKKLHQLKTNPEVARLKGIHITDRKTFLLMTELLDETLIQILKLFNEWRLYDYYKDNKHFKLAKILLPAVLIKFSLVKQILEGSPVSNKYTKQLEELEQRIAILQHLATAQDFLDKALIPLAKEPEATLNRETLNVYEEGITFCAYSTGLFKKYLDEEIAPTFKQGVQHLEKAVEKYPEAETLLKLFNSYYKDISAVIEPFSKEVLEFIEKMRSDPSFEQLKSHVSKLTFLDASYMGPMILSFQAYSEIYQKWMQINPRFLGGQLEKNLGKRLDFHEKLILGQCAALAKKPSLKLLSDEIRSLVEKRDQIMRMKNSCSIDTFRIPSLIMQFSLPNLSLLDDLINNGKVIFQMTTRNYPSYKFSGINLTDLLLQESARIFDHFSNDFQLKIEAETALKELSSAILELEDWDLPHNRNPEKLEALVHKTTLHFLIFQKLMEILCQDKKLTADHKSQEISIILHLLSSFLNTQKFSPSLRNLGFGCFFSTLYQPLGTGLETNLNREELQFMKNLLLRQIKYFDNLSLDIKNVFPSFKEHPELSGLSETFWKMNLDYAKILHQLGNKLKGKVISCSTTKELVDNLKPWMKAIEISSDKMTSLLRMELVHLSPFLKNDGVASVFPHIKNLALLFNSLNFLLRPFKQLHQLHDLHDANEILPQKTSEIKKKAPIRKQEIEEENTSTPNLETPYTSYVPSSSEQMIEPLLALQSQDPIPLDAKENSISKFERKLKMDQAIETHFYLLALLEEEKATPSLKSLFRDSTDHFRVLEMTEKLALAYLPIQQEPHLFNSSHDGVLLAQILAKSEPLFSLKEMEPFLKSQEDILKVHYWFHKEMPSALDVKAIVPHCHKIWSKLILRNSPKIAKEDPLYVSFNEMQRFVHAQKRQFKQNAFPIPTDLRPLGHLIVSLERMNEPLNPILDLSRSLDEQKELATNCPILFTNRHAEVQVSLLSTTLQACLAKFPATIQTEQGLKHALECDHEGKIGKRPLIHSHNVLHLWKTLNSLLTNGDETLEAKLTPFVGDPRYPYPNKTALSQDLVTSFELSQLQEIVESGFFNQIKRALFKKHFPDINVETSFTAAQFAVKEKLQAQMEMIERKTRFAFELALEILKQV